MKFLRKILSFVVSAAMVASSAMPSFAAEQANQETTSVTVHKIVMSNADFGAFTEGTTGKDNSEYNGNAIENITGYFGETAKDVAGVVFAFKNADGTAYIGPDGKTTDADGNAITLATALKATTVENVGATFDTSNLPAGSYTIEEITSESTYEDDGNVVTQGKAVPVKITLPLVNDLGAVTEAHVYPKNTQDKPQIDKNYAEGTDEAGDTNIDYDNYQRDKDTVTRKVGDVLDYQVESTIPQGAKYEKYVLTDTMTNGLTFKRGSLSVAIKDSTGTLTETLTADTNYYVVEEDRGFRLVFTADGLDKLESLAETAPVTIRLEYSATVNENAVVDVADQNTISLDYGNRPGTETKPVETTPVNGQLSFEKNWAIDGNTVTSADETVTATFVLQEKQTDGTWKDVETKTFTPDNFSGQESFKGTFTGLNNDSTYRIIEHVTGYEPQYTSYDENGNLVIVNNKDTNNPTTITPSDVSVITYGKKFVKTNESGERLQGAEFYIKNQQGLYLARKEANIIEAEQNTIEDTRTALLEAVANFNKLKPEEQTPEARKTVEDAQTAYNNAVKAAGDYEFVTKNADNKSRLVVLTSGLEGRFEITGLDEGTYALEEKTAPTGYAKLNGNAQFTVGEGTYTGADTELQYNLANLEAGYGQEVVNRKVTIPQTGGIGTIIFTVAGLGLMTLAYVAMRRNRQENLEA